LCTYCVTFMSMTRKRIEMKDFLTAPAVWELLGLSRKQFNLRLERGVFPPATNIIEGVRYFDNNWIENAKKIQGVM